MSKFIRRSALILTALCSLLPLTGGSAGDKKNVEKNQFYLGKVVPLADILAKTKTPIDADAASYLLVLQTSEGKLYPLIKDDGSRMFFNDKKLLDRPMRLTARIIPDSSFMQVINVHSVIKGKLHDVYYWCDICTIKRFQAGICDCCGEPMEFREVPVKE